ncbi:tetratricopeptide repeat protein [Patiriisocius sp. Uisw_017]|jgi:predicted negative regulator of RcsB-dependent stress response|uniref:tetratricopeptide repeat protein n=1 Tax=Patiriisocius sp. Uisw_017 TaxID=3230968 RepID=UPI0039EA7A9B
MATYKKRGGKPKTKVEKQSAIEDESTTAEVFSTLDEGASKTEAWFEKNQKYVLGFVGVIAVAVLGYLAFIYFIQDPKEKEAMSEMYQAQSYFDQALTAPAKDSIYGLSLNGGNGKYGFLDIIDTYGSTKAANLANYYAGMAYLNTNDYKNAIAYLDEFKSDDAMLGPLAKGAIGDAFVQLDQNDKALGYYETAATMQQNDFTSPRFLLKAGITAMKLGNKDAAIKHFKAITDKYATADQAAKAKTYLAQAEAM